VSAVRNVITGAQPVERTAAADPSRVVGSTRRIDAAAVQGSIATTGWSRSDQVAAYQFLRRRLVYSLVVGSPNHPERLFKRLVIAVLSGAGVTALALLVLGVLGYLKPGNATSWRDGGSVVVEKETGTRYVVDADGVLHPALNYASALLFLNKPGATVTSVSQESLRKAPRGPSIGIPGAPDSLPRKESLLRGPWVACSQTRLDGGVGQAPVVTAGLGMAGAGAPLQTGTGLVVEVAAALSGEPERYLVTDGQRHRLASMDVVRALGYEERRPTPVGAAWLNAIPAAPDLEFVEVPGTGDGGATIAGQPRAVGDLLQVDNPGRAAEFLVVRADGVQPVSALGATLILAAPGRSGTGAAPQRLDAAAAAQAPRSTQPRPDAGWPARVPISAEIAGRNVALCAAVDATVASRPRAVVRILPSVPLPSSTRPITPPQGLRAQADSIVIPSSRGAIVQETTADGQPTQSVSIVTDQGLRYPVGDAETLAALGYAGVKPLPAPKEILDLLPTGPALARQQTSTPQATAPPA
jgi:type VII secretion protein EccB